MSSPNIRFQDISVVVQGPIIGKRGDAPKARQTEQVLQSIRKFLPGAVIILSTWEGSDVSGLDYDEVVFSADPGGVSYGYRGNPKILNNVNRQLVSTVAGLKAVKTPYAIKTRSDLVFEGVGFLEFFGQHDRYDANWKIVEKRVVSCNVYARNPRVFWPFLYHPGDFFNFGLIEDLLAIWDIPLQPLSYSRWFLLQDKEPLSFDDGSDIRYYPEQYIWVKFLEKFGKDVSLPHAAAFSEEELDKSERSIVNNLVLITPKQTGVRWLKQRLTWLDMSTLYSPKEWNSMYHRLVLGVEVPSRDILVRAHPFLRTCKQKGILAALAVQGKHVQNHAAVLLNRIFVRAPRKLARMLRPSQIGREA